MQFLNCDVTPISFIYYCRSHLQFIFKLSPFYLSFSHFLYIVNIYIPLSTTFAYYEFFFNIFSNVSILRSGIVIILGDHNPPGNVTDNNVVLNNFKSFLGLSLKNKILNIRESLLDLISSGILCSVSKSVSAIAFKDAYHLILAIDFSYSCCCISHKFLLKSDAHYSFKRADHPILRATFLEYDWYFLNDIEDANVTCHQLYDSLRHIFELCTPKFQPRLNVRYCKPP